MTKRQLTQGTLFAILAASSVYTVTDAYACESKAVETVAEEAPQHNVAPEGFIALFNGKDIENWVKRSGTCTYEVKDGMVTGTTAKGSPNTFLCTPDTYRDFELKFDVLLHDRQLNSGVQIRSHLVNKQNKHGGSIAGPQVEIEKGPGQSGMIWGERVERRWLSPKADQRAHDHFKAGQWNTYHVIAKGNNIKTFINGQAIEDVDLPEDYDKKYHQGVIGLQVHSVKGDPKWKVSWRNIYIKELD